MTPALQTIAQIARIDPKSLTPERRLDTLGLGSSLGLSMLRSGLNRRLGCKLAPLTWRMTVGELVAATEANGASAAMATPGAKPMVSAAPVAKNGAVSLSQRAAMSGPLGGPRRMVAVRAQALPLHGVDIEDIAAMPAWPPAGDGRAFYDEHFTAAELERAGKQPNPAATLCGVWCAKEAVKKCAPELLALDWRQIEIFSNDDGRPQVRLLASGAAWEFSLSISHSAASAAASVLALRRDGG